MESDLNKLIQELIANWLQYLLGMTINYIKSVSDLVKHFNEMVVSSQLVYNTNF